MPGAGPRAAVGGKRASDRGAQRATRALVAAGAYARAGEADAVPIAVERLAWTVFGAVVAAPPERAPADTVLAHPVARAERGAVDRPVPVADGRERAGADARARRVVAAALDFESQGRKWP